MKASPSVVGRQIGHFIKQQRPALGVFDSRRAQVLNVFTGSQWVCGGAEDAAMLTDSSLVCASIISLAIIPRTFKQAADAAALYAYLRDPVVTELTSYPVASVPMVEAMIGQSLSRWAAGELSKWGVALQHDDQLVGTCGFNVWSQVHRWAELAFDLAQAHWGKGLMRQAVAAVLQWTFRQDQVDYHRRDVYASR